MFVVWWVVSCFDDKVYSVFEGVVFAIVNRVAIMDIKKENRMYFVLKCVETTIGLILITIFVSSVMIQEHE